MSAVVVNFSLDTEKDKKIIEWLGSQSNRSAAIREALKFYMNGEGCGQVTLADILREIRSLPSRLSVIAVSTEGGEKQGQDEPELAAANLNGLLDRLDGGDLG